MATTLPRSISSQAFTPRQPSDRQPKRKEKRTDIWSSLLRQTRQAQARNRSNAASRRDLAVCGGSPEDQRNFLSSLARPPPPAPPSRNRDQREQKPKGQLTLSNRYAYGYGHVTLYSPAQGGALGQEAEEAARLEMHTVGEVEAGYEGVLERLLKSKSEEGGSEQEEEGQYDMGSSQQVVEPGRRPAVVILLSWREPWTFLAKLRAWLQLLAKAVEPTARPEEDIMEILKESKLNINVVVQHVEAQQGLEREGWQEEAFDYVSQVLRTAILPLHPRSALMFTSNTAPSQQPGSPLTECQKTIYQSLGFDLGDLSPKQTPGGTPARSEDLLPKHNVVDRMNLVVPQGWDSVGKIRLLSENFSPEEILSAWQADLSRPVFQPPAPAEPTDAPAPPTEPHTNGGAAHEQEGEVFEAASSPLASPTTPTQPSSPTGPSAITLYASQITDPAAHKAPKPPTITTKTRPEQAFLREMKTELDTLASKDRERPDPKTTNTTRTPTVGLPAGESTGALSGLGDVRYNVGGVSYNAESAEAAIERLKRAPSNAREQTTGGSSNAYASPGAGASRTTTPRPPKREREEREGSGTPSSGGKGGDFPSEDLEKYFASLAKKAGGGGGEVGSRGGTPGRG